MTEDTKRLRILAERQKRIEEEGDKLKGKIVGEIVDIMTSHKIDVNNIRSVFRERFEQERPQNRRYSKRPIRYRDHKSDNTWTGVGVQPRWLRERLQEGYSIDDFKIDPPEPATET